MLQCGLLHGSPSQSSKTCDIVGKKFWWLEFLVGEPALAGFTGKPATKSDFNHAYPLQLGIGTGTPTTSDGI
jgi:hypothetical protein